MHNQPSSLIEKIRGAAADLKAGDLYYHYKDPSTQYRILYCALQEADEATCVVYQNVQQPDLVWVRNLSSWNEQVVVNGMLEARFRPVK